MDWNQLHYFQMLASINNFSKAADELNLSQSALSRSISRLEGEIGVPLFERKSRGVSLNRYGATFLKYVNRAMTEIETAKEEIDDMVNPFHGTISLGFIQTLGFSFVPDLISGFQNERPGITFQLLQDSTSKILNGLELGEIDIGFCSPQEHIDDLSSFQVVKDELYLAVPKDHRLAGKKQVDLMEVANEPFVLFKHGTALRDVVEKHCHSAGFQPKMSFEGMEESIVAGLVAAKFGVALLPQVPELNREKISLIRIQNPYCERTISMVWRTNGYMSPAVAQFKSFVEKVMQTVK